MYMDSALCRSSLRIPLCVGFHVENPMIPVIKPSDLIDLLLLRDSIKAYTNWQYTFEKLHSAPKGNRSLERKQNEKSQQTFAVKIRRVSVTVASERVECMTEFE
ncbi:hypothetical protein LOAG_07489 [Loa loa]|uniref:Uncharacterized protein n=1 Tax=Loa loa TaxID=7209 RepID=A0A1S0TVH3_LOALO|nr:hypothetical protein LOAG_07489 [Loa loa]EFO21000.1 hypothetical protein LOAG_07489 [Loa loa]